MTACLSLTKDLRKIVIRRRIQRVKRPKIRIPPSKLLGRNMIDILPKLERWIARIDAHNAGDINRQTWRREWTDWPRRAGTWSAWVESSDFSIAAERERDILERRITFNAPVVRRGRGEEHREKDGKIAGEIGRDAISISRNLWAKFCSHMASLITREPRQAGSGITIGTDGHWK